MNKYLVALLALVVSGNAVAATGLPQPADVRVLLNSGRPGAVQKAQLGTQVIDKKVQVLKAVYDYSVLGGLSTTLTLKDVDGKDATIPNKALIKQVIIDVLTNFAGTGLISFGANTTTDLKAALSTPNYTTSARVAGIPVGTAATSVKATAERNITATISSGVLTAGKANVFVEYYVSD